MFEYIKGELVLKNLNYVAIDISGLAYKISVSFKTYEKLKSVGEIQKLYIHTNVKEDDISFYGFSSEKERNIFKEVISISGVGPKLGVSILSTFSSDELIEIILSDNNKLLSKVPGLGIKKSQKLILDLKDKIKKFSLENSITEDSGSNLKAVLIKEDIKLALESLGYKNLKLESLISDEEIINENDSSKVMKIILKRIAAK